MHQILYLGLREESLHLLLNYFQLKNITLEKSTEEHFNEKSQELATYQVLLIGEEVNNPVRFVQEAYTYDKGISILVITEGSNLEKIKRALQFSPFIGPTVQCVSSDTGARMFPIIEDAWQRTYQRRSFAKFKNAYVSKQRFQPSVLEKVRANYTSKVLQQAPIGVVLIGNNGVVVTINNYALSLFNKSEKEVLGTTIASFFSESNQGEVNNFLLDGYISQSKKKFEREAPNGPQYLEFTVAPLDLEASVGHKLLIINDITSIVIAQQKNQAHLEELKKLNANLTRVNADLDTFVYTASHDLKAPILNIEGLVICLEQELGPDNLVSVELEHMKKAVNSFKRTVEGLTEVSRLQNDKEQVASRVNIFTLLEEVKQLLEQEIAESLALIELRAAGNPQIFFPKKHLTSILYNLIGNAIKYRSPARSPHVLIKAWCEGEEYYLTVQDNGLGIPAHKVEQVFNLFQRMHSHVEGSGVGLFIVKRIIQNNGGRIRVESKVGVGSVFEVVLKV